MEFTYTLTKRDNWAGLQLAYPWKYMNPLLKFPAFLVLIGGFMAFTGEVAVDYLVLAVPALALLGWLAYPYLSVEASDATITATLTDKGVKVGKAFTSWKKIDRMVEKSNHYVLILPKPDVPANRRRNRQQEQSTVIVIPKRAFDSTQQMESFRKLVRRHVL